MQLSSGEKFWPLDPRPGDIDIEDIAFALSNICRFGGHCEFYSVAQHSVLVSRIVEAETGDLSLAFHGLMHDAAEAYLGDLIRPIKHWSGDWAEAYKKIEARLEKVIAQVFDLPYPMPDAVKRADDIAGATEARDLMGDPEWARVQSLGLEPLGGSSIIPVIPPTARSQFRGRFIFLSSRIAKH